MAFCVRSSVTKQPVPLAAIVHESARRPVYVRGEISITELLKWVASLAPRTVVIMSDDRGLAPIREAMAEYAQRIESRRERDREQVNRANAVRKLAEAERELAALNATTAVKPGFFAKLFGLGQTSTVIDDRLAEWSAVRSTALAEIQRIDTRFSSSELDERPDECEESVDGQLKPFPVSLRDFLPPMTDTLASLTVYPISESTPPAAPPTADLAITLHAERLPVATRANRHVIFANDDNGLWADVRRPQSAWTTIDQRIVCRLIDDDDRDTWTCEPVIDNPAITAWFTEDGRPARIDFPEHWTAADCRRWLAENLDDVRPVAVGEPVWTSGDRIVASWRPIAATDVVDSIAGVREFVCGTAANALTAAVEFEPSFGWTRESAEAWLNDRLAATVPAEFEILPDPMGMSIEHSRELALAN